MKKTVSEGRSAPEVFLSKRMEQKYLMSRFKNIMELISSDGFAYGYRKLTVCLRREYQLQINKKRKCIAYVRSWTSCAHNDRNLLCIHENWLVTERLLTPTSSSGNRH
ncbi:hypothetical protein P7H20_25315 [Paenibacillus larvae]|nr:hypothetical protein [Paenibacillus larvae]MDT2277489.1 hypothetical protein [Paenibacillus larvae]